jgi:hypothetical protein
MSYNVAKIAGSAILALLIGAGSSLPAFAVEGTDIAPDTLAQLNENFDSLQVASSARAGLLEKYADGQAFDSSSGEAPVTTESYRVGITDYVREVFQDGSVSLTSVEHPTTPTSPGQVGTLGLSGCRYQLSAGVATYSNCKVYKNNVVLTEMFHANYYQASGGAGVSLTNTWDWDIQAAGEACQKDSLGTPTSTKARLRAYCTITSGIGSSYPYLDLDVTKTSAKVNANW